MIPFRLYFSFVLSIKIIAPLAYQKESTVSSGISESSSTQQPVSAVTLCAVGDCGSVSDCSLSEQHPVSAENLSDGCSTITDSSSPSEPRRGQKRDTASSTAVPVGARSKRRAVDCNTAVNSGCPYDTNNKNNSWFSSSLSRKKPSATLSFSSRRIRIPGIVNDLAVSGLTVDSTSDITCVSLLFLKQHPTLCKARVETVPPSCMSPRAANGSSIEILGIIKSSLTLGDITRRIDALVIPSLGPDQILLDNDVMSRFGAILDWKNQCLTFSSSTVTITATHRSPDARSQVTSSTVLRSVAAVHKDAEVHTVTLCNRIHLRPRHSAVITAFTDIKPLQDTEVIIEPRIRSENDMFCDNRPVDFERVIVARTLTTWLPADGSVAVQIADPYSESLALHAG